MLRPLVLSLTAALALSAGAAAVVYGTSAGPPPNGSVAVDCDAASASIQDTCQYPTGASFSVQVNVTAAPIGGYYGHQMKLAWNDPQLDYLPAGSPGSENSWGYCSIPIRQDNQTSGPPDPSMLFGCVPIPPLFVGDTTTGTILQFQFSCQQAGSTSLHLVPRAGDPQQGSHFLDGSGSAVDPMLIDASIECTVAPTPTPTPTLSPTPTPSPTATPDIDADNDGCTNGQELGSNPAFGGERDPYKFWDFFDTAGQGNPRDRIISTGDIVRILGRFGSTGNPSIDPLGQPPASGYHPSFDRSPPSGGEPWNVNAPDGVVAANDLLFVVNQFGHTCAGAP
ncbi:MAG: flexitail domain-containing putative surface protein [Dehalococcoidia bacterium]